MKTKIRETETERMMHHKGLTAFKGCQCFKDCTCIEDFKPMPYDYYTVVRRLGTKKQKTTRHDNLDSANERWDFVKALKTN